MPSPTDIRFRRIDDSNRKDHFHLSADDVCFYLMEYTAGTGYQFGEANSIISNLKKSPRLRGTNQYFYKTRDMRACSERLRKAMNVEWLKRGTIVPIPPSKAKDHPEFDDRMLTICRGIEPHGDIDVRELIIQKYSTAAAHEGSRPTIHDLINNYEIVESSANPPPVSIMIIDDVLTAGSHFKAAQYVLRKRYPGVEIYGGFIARRALNNEPDPALDLFDVS